MKSSLPAAAALLLSAPLLPADVRILEDLAAGSFVDLQAAIDAAPEGATLLVGPDDYEAFTIDGKALTLYRIPSGPSQIIGTSVVRNLGPGQRVVLQGLTLDGGLGGLDDHFGQMALSITNCAGPVRIADCVVRGGDALPYDLPSNGGVALFLSGCPDVALTRSHFEGGDGGDAVSFGYPEFAGDGADGVVVGVSAVALYDTTCIGGSGGGAWNYGGDGADGYRAVNGGMFASGCSFEGGDGGYSVPEFGLPAEGGNAGDGLYVTQLAQARLLDNLFSGGHAGSGEPPGSSGSGLYWEGGPLGQLTGTARHLMALEPIVGDDEQWSLRFRGEPGDEVYLMLSAGHGFHFSLVPIGVWLVPYPAPISFAPHGIVPASGVLDLDLPAPDLHGQPGQRFTVQAYVRQSGQKAPLAGTVQVLALDTDGLADCNANGRADILDLIDGLGDDCDGNLVLDPCDFLPDCNGNGIGDGIEIQCMGVPDINGNGIPDTCESADLYVKADAPAGGDGSLAAPFRTLAEAFGSAVDGATVHVFAGVYEGQQNRGLDFAGRGIEVIGLDGPMACVIDGGGVDRIFLQSSPAASMVRIEGLTIRNGHAEFRGTLPGAGGGAFLSSSPAVLRNCRFVSCYAEDEGGGVFGHDLRVENCEFSGNEGWLGGAVYCEGGLWAMSSTFDGNSSTSDGGAIYSRGVGSSSTIAHCIFRGNTASKGGALFVYNPPDRDPMVIDNCFFALNDASVWGGAISVILTGWLSVTNSTFVLGEAPQGASLAVNQSEVALANSILWSQAGSSILLAAQAQLEVIASNVEGGAGGVEIVAGNLIWGTGNLDVDPLFQNPTLGDYRLGGGSPCIDAGYTDLLSKDLLDIDGDGDTDELVPLDLLRAPRRVDDPVPDTGVGAPPLPDMGALERG